MVNNNLLYPNQQFMLQQRPLSGASAIVGFDIDKYLDGDIGKENCPKQDIFCTQTNDCPKSKCNKSKLNSFFGGLLLGAITIGTAAFCFFKKK